MEREGPRPLSSLTTLDHSHVLIKLESQEEQDLCGIRDDVESGRLILDRFEPGNVVDLWIAENMTIWHAVRPVVPGGPKVSVLSFHLDPDRSP